MIPLTPLEILVDHDCGIDLPLPDELKALYGRLQFPATGGRPHVIGNFVTTLDGVVSLGVAGKTNGDEISGSSRHDSVVVSTGKLELDLHRDPRNSPAPLFPFSEKMSQESNAVRPFEQPDLDPLQRIPGMEIPLSPCPLGV